MTLAELIRQAGEVILKNPQLSNADVWIMDDAGGTIPAGSIEEAKQGGIAIMLPKGYSLE